MIRDQFTRVLPVVTIAAQTASADVTGTGVDLQGFGAAVGIIEIGAGGITFTGTNKVEFVLNESDDNSTFTAATSAIIGGVVTTLTNGIVKSLIVAHAAGEAFRFGYIGTKRYISVTADFSGTHATGTPIAATILCMRPDNVPV